VGLGRLCMLYIHRYVDGLDGPAVLVVCVQSSLAVLCVFLAHACVAVALHSW